MRTVNSPFKRTYLAHGPFTPITPRQYVIAFEGSVTEPQYFDGLRQNADRIGINGLSIQCRPLLRSFLEDGCSHPKTCLDLLKTYLDEAKKEAMSLDTLAKHAVDWAVENSLVTRKQNEKYLRLLKDRIVGKLAACGYSPEELIPHASLEPAISDCYRILTELIESTLKKEKYLAFLSRIREECAVFSDDDVACLIVDRDSGSFTDADYDEVLAECRKKKIRFIITNPQFEFWLLLHFTDATDLDRNEIAKNPDLVIDALKQYVDGNPKRVVFSKYVDKISAAIEHEKEFAEDAGLLKNQAGSNVGRLISDMIAGRGK